MKRRLLWVVLAAAAAATLVVCGFVVGHESAAAAAAPAADAAPTPEQLTILAATLVHGLEVQQDYMLAQSPDFVGCRSRSAGGWFCDYSVTYVDESSAVWRITLTRRNVPTVITRLRSVAAPPSN